MALVEACCTIPPVSSSYEPIGETVKVGGVDAYVTGPKDAKVGLIAAYDIFGFHNNTKQFCDRLASVGYRVILPDFFRGEPWPLDQFPIQDMSVLSAWMGKQSEWSHVGPIFEAATAFLKADGAIKIGAFGFCWGAKMCIILGRDASKVDALAFLHPSAFNEEDFRLVKVPLINLPSKDEPDMLPLHKVLEESNPEIAAKSAHHRFDDVHHGWCAARGYQVTDFGDSHVSKRATDALNLVHEFFASRLQ